MSKKIYDINFYDLKNKEQNTRDMVEYMIDRTMSMFKWNNLPQTIPERTLELYLQTNGFVLLTKHDEDYFVYFGGLGGEPDAYYRPSIATIANPAQNWNAQLPILWDEPNENTPENSAVIGLNDPLLKGLIPINRKYASQLSENELTLWLADILCRCPWLLTADNKKDKEAADEFIKNIFDGNLASIQSMPLDMLEGLKEHILNHNQHQALGVLMQLHQYYKASWFNELGLNAMQNQFKKEAISDSEQQMNTDTLTPFIDIMLKCRKEFCDRVNAFYGLDISVELDSAWKDNEIEEDAMIDEMVNGEEEENLSENEIQEEETDNTSEDNNENEETEENSEEEPENTDEQTIEETIENIEEKVDEILDEIKEEEPENKEEEDE